MPTTCQDCGLVTWTGCGTHVDEVMADVPDEQRCRCGD
jgi:hypothetical protein